MINPFNVLFPITMAPRSIESLSAENRDTVLGLLIALRIQLSPNNVAE